MSDRPRSKSVCVASRKSQKETVESSPVHQQTCNCDFTEVEQELKPTFCSIFISVIRVQGVKVVLARLSPSSPLTVTLVPSSVAS